jgi:hypothetical protein
MIEFLLLSAMSQFMYTRIEVLNANSCSYTQEVKESNIRKHYQKAVKNIYLKEVLRREIQGLKV